MHWDNNNQICPVPERDDSRMGTVWLLMAADRCRFQRRIDECTKILEKIFEPDHRLKIWNERNNKNA